MLPPDARASREKLIDFFGKSLLQRFDFERFPVV